MELTIGIWLLHRDAHLTLAQEAQLLSAGMLATALIWLGWFLFTRKETKRQWDLDLKTP